jgi:RIO kinase 1
MSQELEKKSAELAWRLAGEQVQETFPSNPGVQHTPAVSPPPSASDADADFALALKLQQEMDLELAHEEEAQRSRTANVFVTPFRERSQEKAERGASSQIYGESDYAKAGEEDDDEYSEDDLELGAEDTVVCDDGEAPVAPSALPAGQKPHHQAVKTKGRQPAQAMPASNFPGTGKPNQTKKNIVTKHDIEKSGRKNANDLSKQWFLAGIPGGSMDGKSIKIPTRAFNALKDYARRSESARIRVKNHAEDQETHEQVMDKRTRLMLYRLLNSGVLKEINGVISTGKESNVYHATLTREGPGGEELEPIEVAIKVFKTTLSEFKNRTEYMPTSHKRQNPRKIIRLWAEKELANLKDMKEHGMRCPTPILGREHILVMTFCGKDGVPAPHLKDAELSEDKVRELYLECILAMRHMFQEVHLVHGDLSEYNILYFKGHLQFIDVSQAVRTDHGNSLEYLRRDCDNITNFFRRRGLENVLSTRELFDFITDITITEDNLESYLLKMKLVVEERQGAEATPEAQTEEGIFRNPSLSIPRSLRDIQDPFALSASDSYHQALTGQRADFSGPRMVPEILEEEDTPSSTDDEDEVEDD